MPAPWRCESSRKDEIARGIDLFELRRADGGELPPFTAGAHVSIKVPNGLIRKYSLCNDPAERDRYQIAVKREEAGRGGSISLIENVNVGDDIDRLRRRSTISSWRATRRPSSSSPAASASRRSWP